MDASFLSLGTVAKQRPLPFGTIDVLPCVLVAARCVVGRSVWVHVAVGPAEGGSGREQAAARGHNPLSKQNLVGGILTLKRLRAD